MSLGFVKVWTDGCCLKNGWQDARAAIAVSFGILGTVFNWPSFNFIKKKSVYSYNRRVSQSVRGPATNNVAEFEAVTLAVQMAKEAGQK